MTPFYRYILITSFIAINSIAYLTMGLDKYRSINKGRRIPEKNLFVLAFLFGALGIFLGMKAPLYHKAGKSNFKWIVPLLLLINLLIIFYFFKDQLFLTF